MRRPRARSLGLVTGMLLLAGCGGSQSKSTTPTSAKTPTSSRTPGPRLGELLSVPAVGRIYGRCDPGQARWTIRFVNSAAASDGITYRVGTTRPRRVQVDPGQALDWKLVPGRYISHEPPDPVTHFPATTIKTTAPVVLEINQGSEPHVYRVNIRFAVAAAIGDTANCALVSSTATATTYYPAGQPPS